MTIRFHINWKAIGWGLMFEVVGSFFLSLLFGVAIAIISASQKLPEPAAKALLHHTAVLWSSMVLGLTVTLFSGLVCGRSAGERQVFHGTVLGLISSAIGLFWFNSLPLWYSLIALVGTPCFGAAGGYLAYRFPKRVQQDAELSILHTAPTPENGAVLSPLKQLLIEGARSTVLMRIRWTRIAPSPFLIALIIAVDILLTIGVERLHFSGAADFYWHAISSGWITVATLAWICYLLGARNTQDSELDGATGPQLFSAIIVQSLIIGTLGGLAYTGLMHLKGPGTDTFRTAVLWGVWLLPIVWGICAALFTLARGSCQRWPRLVLGGSVLLLVTGAAYYLHQPHYWYAPEPEENDTPRAHLVLSQETMEAQQRLLALQLAQIRPQRPGVVDLYAITFAPYAEESVFRKESGVVAEVMARRFDTAGRTMQLLNHNETVAQFPWATPLNLQRAIQHFASVMDRNEDILFLHLTSHGARNGALSASLWPLEVGSVTPTSLKKWLDDAGVRNRVISISACYAGSWIAPLANDDTLVMTASDADHTSYGCGSRSELTFFGRAMYDEQLRNQTLSFEQAHRAARIVIKKREEEGGKDDGYSNPQIKVGTAIRARLAQLEQRLKSSKP